MLIDRTDKTSIYKNTAVIVTVGLILLGCLIVLKPFMAALMLAVILCLSTWPAFQWLRLRLGNRPSLAAFLMTLLLAACFIAPIVFLGSSLVESFRSLVMHIVSALQEGPHDLPVWVQNIPFIGAHMEEWWQSNMGDAAQMSATLRLYVKPVSERLILLGGSLGHGVLELALGVLISYFLFRHGEAIVTRLRHLIERFGGKVSLRFLQVCETTMMSLVYGILGTALVLGALATIAFYIADIPGAPFLGLLTFFLGIIPGGPPFVLAPVTLWLFYKGSFGMGVFMALWSVGLITIVDLAIRPYFISLGSKMPLIMVLLGVMGGVISFGFIGLFIGPALLSVAYAMFTEWSQAEEYDHG